MDVLSFVSFAEVMDVLSFPILSDVLSFPLVDSKPVVNPCDVETLPPGFYRLRVP